MSKFRVTWDRPVHLNNPDAQIDHGGEELPEAESYEAALAIIGSKRWIIWLHANRCFNIRLYETRPCEEGPPFVIETSISLE